MVRFLREGEPIKFPKDDAWRKGDDQEISIVGKVMLVNNLVKVKIGGKRRVEHEFNSKDGRLLALEEYFGITLKQEEAQSIEGWDMALK